MRERRDGRFILVEVDFVARQRQPCVRKDIEERFVLNENAVPSLMRIAQEVASAVRLRLSSRQTSVP